MSEALVLYEQQASSLPIPRGSSVRQIRLAGLILSRSPDDNHTWTDILRDAGYAETSIRSSAATIREASGVVRAMDALQQRQADRARGVLGLGEAALADHDALFEGMRGVERATFGLQAIKLAHEIGENIEQRGNGEAWKLRLRRACRLMARLTENRLRRPLDVVDSHLETNSQPK